MTSFYRQLDEGSFASSVLTRGPWSAEAQHGGPPAALLGTRMAALAPEGFRAARLTFEMLRPVPLSTLRVEAQVVRAGQQAAWIDAALHAETPRGSAEVMRARGLWLLPRPTGSPGLHAERVPSPADGVSLLSFVWHLPWDEGYHTAIDLAYGPQTGALKTAWIRARVDLVGGAPWTPLGRVLVAVDSIGGACAALSFRDWSFVNADLTCHLLREPVGEWVALAGTQWVEEDGVGLAEAVLHDQRGPIGHGLQSQVVRRRG